MSIGRLGCFLAGLEDHTCGLPTPLPFGVDFGDGIPRHPTQLYEILFLLALAGWFLWRIKTRRPQGCMFGQFVFAYALFRFFVEFIKPRYTLPLLPLSAIQLTCLAAIIYAVLHWNAQCCGKMEAGSSCGAGLNHPSQPANSIVGESCATPPERPSLVVERTRGLCPHCTPRLQTIEAKLVIQQDNVYLEKFCPEHGR